MKFNKFFKAKSDVVATEENQTNSNQLISAEEVKVKSICAGGNCGCPTCKVGECSTQIPFTNRVYFPKCFCGGSSFNPAAWINVFEAHVSVHPECLYVVIDKCMVEQEIEDPCDSANKIGTTQVKLKRIRVFGCVHYNVSVSGIPNDKAINPPPGYDADKLSAANFLRLACLNNTIRYTCDCEDNPDQSNFSITVTDVVINDVIASGSDVAVEVKGIINIVEA